MKSAFGQLMSQLDLSERRRYYWAITGVFLGYPPCCIHQFVLGDYTHRQPAWRFKKLPLANSGYIPCSRCATTHSAEELIQVITARRLFSLPFPNDSYDRPDQWDKEMTEYKARVKVFLRTWISRADQNEGLKALVEELCAYLAEHPVEPSR